MGTYEPLAQAWVTLGVNPWGLGVATPRYLAGGSWTGREILLCLIMYRKYVRKW